jgi:hypothetical protein
LKKILVTKLASSREFRILGGVARREPHRARRARRIPRWLM